MNIVSGVGVVKYVCPQLTHTSNMESFLTTVKNSSAFE